MNKSARILFLIAALVAASFVSYVVYQRMSQQPAVTTVETSGEAIKIAVATKTINRGSKITLQDLRMTPYLKKSLPKGHFTDPSKVIDRIAINSIHETEPILDSELASPDLKKGGMAAIVTPQKRAMAVKVNEVIGVAGFLHPGHLVDVLVSLQKPGSQRTQITKTVLENILVLSVGTQAQESEDKKPKKVTVVTLEVDLEEGEKLAHAVNQGTVQLALRGYSDTDQILTKGVTSPILLKSYATLSNEPVKIAKVESAAPKPTKLPVVKKPLVIEVMNGDQVRRLTMNSD